MTFLSKTILVVVPARGGSKGIPKKNLQKISGQSLVALAAQTISQLDWIDAAILSTDCEEIANEGKSHGLDAPFLRPENLASDHANSKDMWRHAWLASEENYKQKFNISVLLEPTSPLRILQDIENVVELLIHSGKKSVVTVSRNPGHFTPERTLVIDNDNHLSPYRKDGLRYTARQTIPPYYHRNGIAYAVTRESLIEENNLMETDCIPLIIDRPVVNIDENIDLKWAEFLIQNQP